MRAESIKRTRIAASQHLAVQAIGRFEDHLDLALLLAVEAYDTEPTAEARDALFKALEYRPRLAAVLHGSGEIRTVLFNSDGKQLLTANDRNDIVWWDVGRRIQTGRFRLPCQNCSAVFAPDDQRLIFGGEEGLVQGWDLAHGETTGTVLRASESAVMTLAFSPDRRTLAAGYASGRIILWDLITGQGNPALAGGLGEIHSVAFSPNGRCRRLAKDFENLNRNALAFIKLASIRLMLRKLSN